MAPNGLLYADVPLTTYTLTQEAYIIPVDDALCDLTKYLLSQI